MKSVEEPYVETTIYSIGFSTCLECFSPFLIEFRMSNREKGWLGVIIYGIAESVKEKMIIKGRKKLSVCTYSMCS